VPARTISNIMVLNFMLESRPEKSVLNENSLLSAGLHRILHG